MLPKLFSKKFTKSGIQNFLSLSLGGLMALMIFISGCTLVGPDYVKPEAPEPENSCRSS